MRIVVISEEEMYQSLEENYNPPIVRSEGEEQAFQTEVRSRYEILVDRLAVFGEEGDFYGVSDFAVRPDLKPRKTVSWSAPHNRQFTITIITEKFYRSDYLKVLCRFLAEDAKDYRIWVDQEFDSEWTQTLILYPEVVKIYCDREEEFRITETIIEAC